jgi:hypothetical protein
MMVVCVHLCVVQHLLREHGTCSGGFSTSSFSYSASAAEAVGELRLAPVILLSASIRRSTGDSLEHPDLWRIGAK